MSQTADIQSILKLVPTAPPLPQPTTEVARVASPEQLIEAIESAKSGTTILLADGVYEMPRDVILAANDVTIRSESGDRQAVVLDGGSGDLCTWGGPPAIIRVKHAHRAMFADITFRNSIKYAIMFYGDRDVQGLRVYNCVFHNIWVRGLKGTCPTRPNDAASKGTYPPHLADRVRSKDGEVRYCLFYTDSIKTDLDDGFDGDYISGMDMMGLSRWTIADSVFVGLRGANGKGRGAIFIWQKADHITVERNVFVNCDRAISFGNPSYTDVNVSDSVIRDNMIVAGVYKGIECCSVRTTDVYNNRIHAGDPNCRAVEFRDDSRDCHFHHNIVDGQVSMPQSIRADHNHVGKHDGCFVDPTAGNLQLTNKGNQVFGSWRDEPAGGHAGTIGDR